SAIMAAALWFGLQNLDQIYAATLQSKIVGAAILVVGGALIYAVAAPLTGAIRPSDLRQVLRRG
ncbi:MAG: murein biosynthesis integral membrane protein MurJ, partial [Pseudomonadota bacterium]